MTMLSMPFTGDDDAPITLEHGGIGGGEGIIDPRERFYFQWDLFSRQNPGADFYKFRNDWLAIPKNRGQLEWYREDTLEHSEGGWRKQSDVYPWRDWAIDRENQGIQNPYQMWSNPNLVSRLPDEYRSGIPDPFAFVDYAAQGASPTTMEYTMHPWFDIAKDEYLEAAERQKNIWERSGQTEMVQGRMADRAPGLLAGQKEPPTIKPIEYDFETKPGFYYMNIPTLPNPHPSANPTLGSVYKTKDSYDQSYLQQNIPKISQRINYQLPQPSPWSEFMYMPQLTTERLTERVADRPDTFYTPYPNVPTTIPPIISPPLLQGETLLEDMPPSLTTDWAKYNRGY